MLPPWFCELVWWYSRFSSLHFISSISCKYYCFIDETPTRFCLVSMILRYIMVWMVFHALLTLSLPRVINFKFHLQPHQKYTHQITMQLANDLWKGRKSSKFELGNSPGGGEGVFICLGGSVPPHLENTLTLWHPLGGHTSLAYLWEHPSPFRTWHDKNWLSNCGYACAIVIYSTPRNRT